ncbi:MAG: hypothetical protein JSU63_12825 [Phycisphaerales bacterium]|nr:MAG: hypothetical protein JSU63_12825 [Phycisphaerales bacterium]
MGTVNWLLINLAAAVIWLWEGIRGFFAAVFTALDSVLNPVLSPVLAFLNPICTTIGDGIYALLGPLPIWLGLTVISVVAGVLMLVVFRYTSNQEGIGWAKDDIKANLLALKLFKENLWVTWVSQCRLLWAVLRLQGHMLKPFMVMLVPMLLGLAQMGVRYQWRPLRIGERTNVILKLADGITVPGAITLEPNAGLVVEVGSVPSGREFAWRVRAAAPGSHMLKFHIGELIAEKGLVVGDALERVSAERTGPRWTAQLFHPVERRLSSESPVQSIVIEYPSRESYIYGANWWVLSVFVISLIAAILLRPVFNVRF